MLVSDYGMVEEVVGVVVVETAGLESQQVFEHSSLILSSPKAHRGGWLVSY